ncbi:MAG: Beta-lactamase [Chthoniobacteraceae bacterium]|nr:Beta-lactamase [Chthoniobacteraceae bacterium]
MWNKRAAFATLASLLLAPIAQCAEPAPEDITSTLEPIRQQNAVPALAAAAIRDGHVTFIGATGVRKFGSQEAVTVEDRWHIGSCTKSMTASLAAMLVEEGKLSWETTVSKVFPELRDKMNPQWREVTLEQLLTHRAGAPHDPPPALWNEAFKRKGTPTEQRLAFIRGILAQKPEADPGTKFIYSNQGYSIAGAMIERITGKPWETLLAARLFTPLKMTSAGFGAPATPGRVDQPWGHQGAGATLKPVPPGPNADNPPSIGPGGTVHCSIGDLVRYAGWHAASSRNERLLLNDTSFTRLHTSASGQDYAMGWNVTERGWAGGRTLVHNGTNTMFYAVIWIAPEKNAAFVAATNAAGPAAEKACDDAISALVQRQLAQ